MKWFFKNKQQKCIHPSFKVRDKRTVIIHNHVFKNAGSTIDWALSNNFKKGFVDHRDDDNMRKEPEYLKRYLLEHPNTLALSSHHLRLPLPKSKSFRLVTIMMFRHPIERVTSVYNFEKKQVEADTLGARFARTHTLKEYVLWRMRNEVPPTIRNFHVFKTLSGSVSWQKQFGSTELLKAKKIIDSLELLGLVERFDESMLYFENILSMIYPNIDLSYKIQNVGQKLHETQELRIEKLKYEIGAEAFKVLMDRNQLDLELYQYAKRVFKERINHVNIQGTYMKDFLKRCQNHEKLHPHKAASAYE
jgi:hypothetical protein